MKYFKTSIFLFLFAFLLSCEEKEYLHERSNDLGANLVLTTTSISKFDVSHTIAIKIINHPSVTVSKVEVESGGNKIDATIADNVASFNSSLFGSLEGKESVSFTTNTTLSSGEPYEKTFSVSIVSALELSKEVAALTYSSSAADTLAFETNTKSAKVNSVILEWKKNKAGTYAVTSPTGAALKVKGDEIRFVNVDNTTYSYGLEIKDTLYYRFVATSGTLKDTLELTLPVNSQTFGEYKSSSVYSDMTKNKLNLSTTTHYLDSDPKGKGEIVFKTPLGFEKEGMTAIDFVKVGALSSELNHVNTSEKFYKEKDLLAIKRVYDAGTKTTSVDNPAKDDLYVYKITRDKKTTYGLIKIGSVEKVTIDNETSTTIDIEFGEGEIK